MKKFKEGQVYYCLPLDAIMVVGCKIPGSKLHVFFTEVPYHLFKQHHLDSSEMVYIGEL